jgi:putative copper export protein
MRQRRSRLLATLFETFWILVLAFIVLFVFFVALGAFSPGDVIVLTLAVAVLTLAWIAHAAWDSRHRDPHDRSIIRARERRGF